MVVIERYKNSKLIDIFFSGHQIKYSMDARFKRGVQIPQNPLICANGLNVLLK